MTVPLSTLNPGEGEQYIGCWCEITGAPDFLGVYEGGYLGGRVKVPNEHAPIYPGPENIIIRTDIPRAWTPNGHPPPKEEPTP